MDIKCIIEIGGAASQCHALEILKSWGYYVIVVDLDEKCAGSVLADKFYNVSTSDVDSIVDIAKKENACAVFSVQSDLGMMTAARVSEILGLKGTPSEIVELFTDKSRMRDFLKNNGFFYPEYRTCYSDEDIKEFAEINGYPFVIKPLNSQGSRGVQIIENEEMLPRLEKSEQYNRGINGAIVEDYLGNEEYTVEGIVIAGKHYTLGVSQKTHYEKLNCVSKELYYSWRPEYDELISSHNRLMELTGLPFGITHSEYIKSKNGFTLVEFAARGGGSMIASHVVPAISGWDVEEIYLKELLDEEVIIKKQDHNYSVLKFLELEERIIECIEGIDDILAMESILHFELHYGVGDKVQPVLNDTNRHGFYIAWAKSEDELRNVMNSVESVLRVVYKE